jgi:helicase
MISHTIEMHPLLSARQKDMGEIEKKILLYAERMLDKEPSMFDFEYEGFVNSVKTAIFFHEWIHEKDEEYLLEKFNVRPGEIMAKLDLADWLLYSSSELCKLIKHHDFNKHVSKLRIRLKYGVKEELIPLLQLKGIGRKRARKLFRNNIKNLKDLKEADVSRLGALLGKETAANVKSQLGEKAEDIPKGRRKGQLSLKKY